MQQCHLFLNITKNLQYWYRDQWFTPYGGLLKLLNITVHCGYCYMNVHLNLNNTFIYVRNKCNITYTFIIQSPSFCVTMLKWHNKCTAIIYINNVILCVLTILSAWFRFHLSTIIYKISHKAGQLMQS